MHACRVLLSMFAVLLASEVVSFGASIHSLPDDPTKLDPKSRLLSEARTFVHNNKENTERMLRVMRENVQRRGGFVPDQAPHPPAYPKGKFTKAEVRQRNVRVGDRIQCEVAGNISVAADMAERFAVQLIVLVRNADQRKVGGTESMRTIRGGNTNNINLTNELQVQRPGRHDVLFILVAHPINGGKPAILGVENSTFNVAKR